MFSQDLVSLRWAFDDASEKAMELRTRVDQVEEALASTTIANGLRLSQLGGRLDPLEGTVVVDAFTSTTGLDWACEQVGVERDFELLQAAAKSGRIQAEMGI